MNEALRYLIMVVWLADFGVAHDVNAVFGSVERAVLIYVQRCLADEFSPAKIAHSSAGLLGLLDDLLWNVSLRLHFRPP